MKTFPVRMTDGTTTEAYQLATFTYPLENVVYRFVVTRVPGQFPVVTHRETGVCVTNAYEAQFQDAKHAGVMALDRLVERVGAKTLRQKLDEIAEGV